MSTMGVDTGGTFTDLVYLHDDGRIEVAKRPSTPPNFSHGVINVVEAVDQGRGVLKGLDYFYHGTTVATNAMITGSGAKIGFITTAGHRDALPMMRIIGRFRRIFGDRTQAILVHRQTRAHRSQGPNQRGPRANRLQGSGRGAAERGECATGGQSVAERRRGGDWGSAFCGLSRTAAMSNGCGRSSKKRPQASTPRYRVRSSRPSREYERSATTAVKRPYRPAIVKVPRGSSRTPLGDRGLTAPLFVMQSMGGVMQAADVDRRSVNTLASGPAGGVVGVPIPRIFAEPSKYHLC